MSCEIFRQFALDQNWDQPTRRRASETLQHLDSCPECQHAVQDYDRLRGTLGRFVSDAIPPAGWDELPSQIQLPAPSSPPAIVTPRPIPISRYPSRIRIVWTAIAASIFIAASVAFELGQAAARPVSSQRPGGFIAADRAFAPPELPGEIDQFSQLANYFDGRVSWMLTAQSATDMNLAGGSEALSGQLLVLRLTLTHGPELTSTADLLIVPGQAASFTIPTRNGPALHYRVNTSEKNPARVAVALELTTPAVADPLAALATNLQLQPGEKLTAGRLVTASGEYELNISFAYAGLPEEKR